MNQLEYFFSRLNASGIYSKDEYYQTAFARNIGILSTEEQDRLSRARVAIPGMGGVGGSHLITLVRSGIGNFHLADFDVFEPVNINRQYGARTTTFERSKLDTMSEEALDINPFLNLLTFPDGIHEGNMELFLDGVDVVLDGLDFFNFETRRLLFNSAKAMGVPVITAGPLGLGSALLLFHPTKGMDFDEYFDITDEMSDEEKYLHFALGLAPKALQFKYMDTKQVNLKAQAGPSSVIACNLCSALAAAECLRIILNRPGLKPAPHFFQFDPYMQKFKKGYLWRGNQNPIQKVKKKYVTSYVLKNQSGPVSRQLPEPPDIQVSSEGIPEEVMRYLVSIGSWAPSADNCQPWRFLRDGDMLKLISDPERTGFFYDVNNESTLITFGAVIENIDIAASQYGLQIKPELISSNAAEGLVVNLHFRKSDVSKSDLIDHLPQRTVNRKAYYKNEVSDTIKLRLQEVVKKDEIADLVWIDSPGQKKAMQKIVALADQILFEEKRLHYGLFKWIRLGEGKKRLSPEEGMGVSELELDAVGRMVFPLVKQWGVLSTLNKLGFSKALGMNSIKLLQKTPAYCLVTVSKRDSWSFLLGGRVMERFWIAGCGEDLSMQPMAGFIFLLNHYFTDGAKSFSKKHRDMMQEIKERYEKVCNQIWTQARVPIMFLRVGYVSPQKSMSSRRYVESIYDANKKGTTELGGPFLT